MPLRRRAAGNEGDPRYQRLCLRYILPRTPLSNPKAWSDGKLRLVLSAEILDEYRRVGESLAEQFPAIDLGPILEWITITAEMFVAQALPESVCADPDDDKFLACALASKSKVIVSGDRHLLQVSGFREIRIVRPREFVDEYLSKLGKSQPKA